ncbi:MAG: isoprenyl transferase [Clostridiales bacterium GWB2_37_7]|nr:MAG: isoprenyl transferase [Clostridiales bacterium GWB2_37_7]
MQNEIDSNRIPKHIAIIMDGNGRWASKRALPRVFGHKAGMETLREVVRACSDMGIEILTVYAFSTENWNRPTEEVSYLMNLLIEYMRKEINELNKNNVKIKILGDLSPLPKVTREEVEKAVRLTGSNTGIQFNIALNYGGRAEIINACKKIAEEFKEGKILKEQITEELISSYLFTSGDIEPDLIIRTSGEKRLSNFLLWQSAYSELVFVDEMWPDFNSRQLEKAIMEFQNRDRRFGLIKKSSE